ncbi:MAG: hypothetical protein GF364_19755 [Candidatus Lokiarchaeota archaeon]|nr:hypothetical protein [Candidatus Lokiarchaeota archaeon]
MNKFKKFDEIEEKLMDEIINDFSKLMESSDLSTNQKLMLLRNQKKRFETQEVPFIRMREVDRGLFDLHDLGVKAESFSKVAYKDVKVDILYEMLREQDVILQEVALTDHDFDESVTDEEVKRVNSELNKAIDDLWHNHYSNLAVAFSFYGILEEFYSKTGLIYFVRQKNSLMDLMIKYNSRFDLVAEKTGMYLIYSVTAMIDNFKSYLGSADYSKHLQLQRTAQVNVTSRTNCVSNPYEGYLKTFTPHETENAVNVNVVKVTDIDIDPNDTKTLSQRLVELKTWFDVIKRNSEAIYTRIEKELEYNISTGQVSGELTNEKMMDLIKNTRYLRPYFENISSYQSKPRIFLSSSFKAYNFDENADILGKTIKTINFPPGVSRDLIIKTGEKTKEGRSKTSTVFDSNSEESNAEFTNEAENERERTSQDTEELRTYIDSQSYLHGDTCVNAKIFGKGADVNIDSGIDVQAGIGKQISKERTESAKNICKAAQKQAQKAMARRDMTVSEASEVITETEREEISRVHVENPNKAGSMSLKFRLVIDSYLTFAVFSDLYVVFSNGGKPDRVHISNIDGFLDTYIQYPKARENIKNEIRKAAVVFDYQGRKLQILDENMEMIRTDFVDLLTRCNQPINDQDQTFMQYFDKFFGVPLYWYRTEMEKPGCFVVIATVDDPALDSNEQRLMDAHIHYDEATAQKLDAEVDSLKVTTKMRWNLFSKIITMDGKSAAHAYFIALSDSKNIYDKSRLIDIAGTSFKDKEL